MKPMVFSMTKFKQKHPELSDCDNPLDHLDGWERGCENISYTQNHIQRNPGQNTDTTKVFD